MFARHGRLETTQHEQHQEKGPTMDILPQILRHDQWAYEPEFTPTPEEEREAAFIFGETASYEEEDRFSEWVDRLPDGRSQSVRRALDVLRSAIQDFQSEETHIGLDAWLETLAPDSERYEEAALIDCHGIGF